MCAASLSPPSCKRARVIFCCSRAVFYMEEQLRVFFSLRPRGTRQNKAHAAVLLSGCHQPPPPPIVHSSVGALVVRSGHARGAHVLCGVCGRRAALHAYIAPLCCAKKRGARQMVLPLRCVVINPIRISWGAQARAVVSRVGLLLLLVVVPACGAVLRAAASLLSPRPRQKRNALDVVVRYRVGGEANPIESGVNHRRVWVCGK